MDSNSSTKGVNEPGREVEPCEIADFLGKLDLRDSLRRRISVSGQVVR